MRPLLLASAVVCSLGIASRFAYADDGHDFTTEGKALLAVGACGDIEAPAGFPKTLLTEHCEVIKKAQDDYLNNWVKPAREFFASHVPKDVPKKVVYPFAGGDLSTALTVYPDADEITTISLEPSGDPRDLGTLKGKDLEKALKKVEYELKFLYRVNFSNTVNMIDAMRGGALPTELIFALSALKIHGFEVVSLKYFSLNQDGAIHYLDDDDLKKAGDAANAAAQKRNWFFANAELQFKRPGGRIQIYRHIRANLGNDDGAGIGAGTKADPRVIKHLEAKGDIAAMTKAASYLLSWESFSIMRDYLHVSAEGAAKVHDFSLRSLNYDGWVAKNTMDSEIRLAREQLKISDEITEDKIMDWRFLKEVLGQK